MKKDDKLSFLPETEDGKVDLNEMTDSEILEVVVEKGSERKACRYLGVARTTFQERHKLARLRFYRERKALQAINIERPATGVKHVIYTSAQDATVPHQGFLLNLKAYAQHLGADLMISGFTYSKRLFEEHSKHHASFHQDIRPYLMNERVHIDGKIALCGEMNTLPTAVDPLSGYDVYTKQMWGVFPHAKVRLKSIPTMKSDPAKQIMTTGTCTRTNYIPKNAGIKASFHHVIGAVIISIDSEGDFFIRHLLAEDSADGAFYDLDHRVSHGQVTTGNRVEAINWGDIHREKLDPTVAASCWGYDPTGEGRKLTHGDLLKRGLSTTIIDALKPRYQFMHDTHDFSARNHHNIRDFHFIYKQFCHGQDSVEADFNKSANFLHNTKRDFCKSVAVESNHDLAIEKWLKVPDAYANDPINAEFFLEAQARKMRSIRLAENKFSIFEWSLKRNQDYDLSDIVFLREDDSFLIAGDIECGNHGHLGANGARGTPKSYARMGGRSNTGHTHSPEIIGGSYVSGVSGVLDMGYNSGLSSWAHAHIFTYPNGKRVIITMRGSKWRA